MFSDLYKFISYKQDSIKYTRGVINISKFYSLFAGKMLGDGYMNIPRNSPRFGFLHSSKDKDYAEHCYKIFSRYVEFGAGYGRESRIYDKRTGKYYGRVYYQSKISPMMEFLYSIWYPDGYKVIPMEWVESYIDPEGLALWYQDDGHLKDNEYRIILSTESFDEEEILFLKGLLGTKFNINSTIDIQGRLDISSRREVCKFLSLVEPFIHLSMKRKSIQDKLEKWILEWSQSESREDVIRTSIYLPYDLYYQMRGQGYSQKLNELLPSWLDTQWNQHLIAPDRRYKWILDHEEPGKERFLLTPRFHYHVKRKLDLISLLTGFERSELVSMALRESQQS